MPTARALAQSDTTADATASAGQRTHVPTAEMVLFVAAALLYWTDILRLLFPGTDGTSAVFRLTHFTFYGLYVLAILRALGDFRRALAQTWLLVAFLLLPMASALWSVYPEETIQRAIAVLGSSLFGYYAATQVAPLTTLRLFGVTATLAALLSIVLIVFIPSMGHMSEGEYVNVWSGAWVHKNGMGQMCGLGALICLIVLMTDGVRRNGFLIVGLAINLLLLAGSRSLTSQLVTVVSIVLLFTVGRFLRFVVRHALVIMLLAAAPIGYAAFTLTLDHVFGMLTSFGKDATLSSRLPLWQILVEFINEKFWLGFGYEAFFIEANYTTRIIESRLHFRPYYSHNGYIELWLALGAVGFAIMTALFLRFAWQSSRLLYRDERAPLFLLCFIYSPIFLLQNTAEVTILQRNSMSWTLFVMLYVCVALASHEMRRRDAGVTHRAVPRVTPRLAIA